MKKILYFIVLTFLIIPVNAKEPANLVTLTSKCGIVKENTLIIPVTIISTNNGGMSKLISEYTLGKIESQDTYTITIKNLESEYLNNITIDKLKDSNNHSNIKYNINDDVELKKGEPLASLELEINFKEVIPDSIYILGNDFKISKDESICELINGYKTEIVEYEKITQNKNINLYIVIASLLFLVILENIFLINKKYKK